jgi:hypothetical protein
LALKGLSDAARALDSDQVLQIAIQNATFIEKELIREGRLFRTWKNGVASIDAYLEDYALVGEGMLALYEATFDTRWLQISIDLTNYCIAHFYDEKEEFFFFTSDESEALIARKKEIFDNVIPSSNAVMATVLYRLGLLLYKDDWVETATTMVSKMNRVLHTDPAYLTYWACLHQQITTPTAEVVFTGPDALENRKKYDRTYFPLKIVAGSVEEEAIPCLDGRIKKGENWIYYCQNKTCQKPVNSVDELLSGL